MEHLQSSQRNVSAIMADDNIIHDFLNYHMSHNVQYGRQIFASEVDVNKYVSHTVEKIKFYKNKHV